jgi:hypothetical protein
LSPAIAVRCPERWKTPRTPALATIRRPAPARDAKHRRCLVHQDIAHYIYAGDTALHVAAAAFRRDVAEMLVRRGADCHAKNRRGAQPLHYAADANRSEPGGRRRRRWRI